MSALSRILATACLVACSSAPSPMAGAGGVDAGGAPPGGSTSVGGSSAGNAGAMAVSGAGPTTAGTPNGGGGAASAGSESGGSAGASGSGGSEPMGPVRHHVMAIEYPGKLVEISAEGEKLWEHQTPSLTVMFDVLPSGNVFYPHGGTNRGAEEVDREHHVAWSYVSGAGELLGGERLANGNTLLGEGGPARAIELNSEKAIVRSVPVPTTETAAHGQIRHLHRLDNGNVLVSLESEGVVRELDASGKSVWEYGGVKSVHEAVRLPNGNTLIGGGESKRVIEVSPAGQIAWEFGAEDAPELGLTWITSIQVLKNGDLLVGNWLGANGGDGVHAFQVTRDKQVVWKLTDHQLLKSATMVTALDD